MSLTVGFSRAIPALPGLGVPWISKLSPEGAIHEPNRLALQAVGKSCSGDEPERKPGEATDILRSLVDRFELRPNSHSELEIDLYGDVARILSLAGKKEKPLITATWPFCGLA